MPVLSAFQGRMLVTQQFGAKPPRAANPANPTTEMPTISNISNITLLEPKAEARRQWVLKMLAERPGIRYAVLTDTEADPEAVLLPLAIRDHATCELRIPRKKYDPFLLHDLIERHVAIAH